MKRVLDPLTDFLRDESAGGIALLAASVVALLWANVPAGDGYASFWAETVAGQSLQHWVNDGLMVLFFFVVGLEIKRELVTGELSDRRAAALPALAAVGGVVLPALIFLAVMAGSDESAGWAIPVATDIAFAVGVMALLGDRVSSGVKLFLLSIAIVDDIIAITIIALFYAEHLSLPWLGAAVAAVLLIVALQRAGVTAISVYALVGLAAWYAMHESGVHATIAGVVLGLLTPARPVGGRDVMHELEHRLHPVTAFAVVPLFALANAGVDFGGGVLGDALGSRLMWAIAGGLVLGKLLGISAATFAALRGGWGTLPSGMQRGQAWGVAALGGIGFTVSLFITDLAFEAPETVDTAKIGVFAGSLASGVLGALLLARGQRYRRAM